MSAEDDRVRLIAERVARRVASSDAGSAKQNQPENGSFGPETGLE